MRKLMLIIFTAVILITGCQQKESLRSVMENSIASIDETDGLELSGDVSLKIKPLEYNADWIIKLQKDPEISYAALEAGFLKEKYYVGRFNLSW